MMWPFDSLVQFMWFSARSKAFVRLFNYNHGVYPICGLEYHLDYSKLFHPIDFLFQFILEGNGDSSSWYSFGFSSFFKCDVAFSFELSDTCLIICLWILLWIGLVSGLLNFLLSGSAWGVEACDWIQSGYYGFFLGLRFFFREQIDLQHQFTY